MRIIIEKETRKKEREEKEEEKEEEDDTESWKRKLPRRSPVLEIFDLKDFGLNKQEES